MKVLKIGAIVLIAYVAIVVAFESLIGFFQPEAGDVLVIRTTDGAGASSDRVLSRLESGGQLYVASNHWFRSWYDDALQNPSVQATFNGVTGDYQALRVTDEEEFRRIDDEFALPVPIRVLTGFPPRYLVRLDPR